MVSYPPTATARQLKKAWTNAGEKYLEALSLTINKIKEIIKVLLDERDKLNKEAHEQKAKFVRVKREFVFIKREYKGIKRVHDAIRILKNVENPPPGFLQKIEEIEERVKVLARRERDLFPRIDALIDSDREGSDKIEGQERDLKDDLRILTELEKYLEGALEDTKKGFLKESDLDEIERRIEKVRNNLKIIHRITIEKLRTAAEEESLMRTINTFSVEMARMFEDIKNLERDARLILKKQREKRQRQPSRLPG